MVGLNAKSAVAVCVVMVALLSASVVQSAPVTYGNYKHSVNCTAAKMLKPLSVTKVAQVVARAAQKRMRVRAVGGLFSSNRIICTKGYALDMSALNRVDVNAVAMEVTTGAGATLQDIYSRLKERGFSLRISGSRFSGATIGGLLGTGSFVSTLKVPALFDQVRRMTIVNGRGNILVVTGPDLRATSLNLGALGVVVDVTLPIVPLFKMKVEVTRSTEELITSGKVIRDARVFDMYRMSWFISKAALTVTKGTFMKAKNVTGEDFFDAGFRYSEFIPTFARDAERSLRRALKGNRTSLCSFEGVNLNTHINGECCSLLPFKNSSYSFKNPATGYMHDMTTTGCSRGNCSWDGGPVVFHSESNAIAIRLEHLPNAFQRMRDILRKRKMCFLTAYGVQILFLKKSDRYLSPSHGFDVAVILLERPLRRKRTEPNYGSAAVQEVAFMLMNEFNGRPSWEHTHTLLEPFPQVQKVYPNWHNFEQTRANYGSKEVFNSEFLQAITRTSALPKARYCEILNSCNCSNDTHCAIGEVCRLRDVQGVKFKVCMPRPPTTGATTTEATTTGATTTGATTTGARTTGARKTGARTTGARKTGARKTGGKTSA